MRASPKVLVVGMLGVAAFSQVAGGGSRRPAATTSSQARGEAVDDFSTAKVSGVGTVVVDGKEERSTS